MYQNLKLFLVIKSCKIFQIALIKISTSFDEHHFQKVKSNIPCTHITERVFRKLNQYLFSNLISFLKSKIKCYEKLILKKNHSL